MYIRGLGAISWATFCGSSNFAKAKTIVNAKKITVTFFFMLASCAG
jgi:hypothetical protein